MRSYLCRLVLRILGFELRGDVGNALPKKIYAVVPHTSAWDFIIALLVQYAYHLRVNFIGKQSLFRPPLGYMMRSLGGRPVDRSRSSNMVDILVSEFDRHACFALALAPEGTRKKVQRLKTGFYQVARMAQVPIILVRLDFQDKCITFAPPFIPSDDRAADFRHINRFFRGARGYHAHYSYEPPEEE